MSDVCTIRRAEKKDAGRVLELLVQIARLHHDGRPDIFRDTGSKYTIGEVEAIIADDMTPVFVAESEGYVTGYVFCAIKQKFDDSILTDAKMMYIDDLCVDERFRNRGIGKALFRYAIDYSKAIGCYNLTLNVWEFNKDARRFYESMGLVPQRTILEMIFTEND